MKRRSTIVLAITLASVAFGAAILLSIAGMGGFDPSGRAISDPPEGTVTQSVENPARPEHPGFPPPASTANNSNNSLPSRIDGNPPVAQSLLESTLQQLLLLSISK